MRLLLDCVAPHPPRGHPLVRVAVGAGEWARVADRAPDALLAAVAGLRAASGSVVLDGRELGGMSAPARVAAGLATVTGRLPDLPALRLVDVLRLRRPRGLRRVQGARHRPPDDEASARALAGRLGLAGWLDAPAAGLPPAIVAAADLLRAFAQDPIALVWREPEWLGDQAGAVADILATEQARTGLAVVALRALR